MTITLNDVQSFNYYIGVDTSFANELANIRNSPYQLTVVNIDNNKISDVPNSQLPDKLIFGYVSPLITNPFMYNTRDYFVNGQIPEWVLQETPPWKVYQVKFWEASWQKILFAWIDDVIKSGADGIFLDGIDPLIWQPSNTAAFPIDQAHLQDAHDLLIKIHSHIADVTSQLNITKPFYTMSNGGYELFRQYPDTKSYVDTVLNEGPLYNFDMTASTEGHTYPVVAIRTGYSAQQTIDFINSVLPDKKVFTVDYTLSVRPPVSPRDLFETFKDISLSGIVPSIQKTYPDSSLFSLGPYEATATATNNMVTGARNLANLLSGGVSLDAKIIGGNLGDFIQGGRGKNEINSLDGNDYIVAHAPSSDKLIINVSERNVNIETHPSIIVLINDKVALDKTVIQAHSDITTNIYEDIAIDTASYGKIEKLEIKSVDVNTIDQNTWSLIVLNRMTYGSSAISLADGSYSGGQFNQNGGYPYAILNQKDGSVVFKGTTFPTPLTASASTADKIDGGNGIDTVVYQAKTSDFTISGINQGIVLVATNTSSLAPDTLTNVERLKFTNTNLALDINGNAGEVYRLYQAAFDRKPDAVGLGFWIAQIDKGASLKAVADGFLTAGNFQNLYPSNAAFVDALYQHVFHRAGDPDGIAFWNNALNHGASRAEVLLGFTDNAQNKVNVLSSIQNGIEYKEWIG